jgi:hypothetical protein
MRFTNGVQRIAGYLHAVNAGAGGVEDGDEDREAARPVNVLRDVDRGAGRQLRKVGRIRGALDLGASVSGGEDLAIRRIRRDAADPTRACVAGCVG